MSTSTAQDQTRILSIRRLTHGPPENQTLAEWWASERSQQTAEAKAIEEAARLLRTSDHPVAFPTETVYGLAADATRSIAVQGIYRAKQRPSDNPLIIHIDSMDMLKRLLHPSPAPSAAGGGGGGNGGVGYASTVMINEKKGIPAIYEPLVSKFWPGPLTIILPNPSGSCLAKEVTSNLTTFGVRMPASPLARLLIHATDRPLAAPSANASTKPSPTTAQHVYHDMHGRIELILDGGPCGVGVESTVVDGLCDPPALLRPGGIGIEEIRACPGWENVHAAYSDGSSEVKEIPRAPGMKYRHYSPKARVVLFEVGSKEHAVSRRLVKDLEDTAVGARTVGIVRTRHWPRGLNLLSQEELEEKSSPVSSSVDGLIRFPVSVAGNAGHAVGSGLTTKMVYDYSLGADVESIARGLFSALRAMDDEDVDVVFVEGISDDDGDLAAAVMNRLRKAAGTEVRAI